MMSILIKGIRLKVKVGENIGEEIKTEIGIAQGDEIKTEIGIAQGDCLSAVIFIYFLAKFINPTTPDTDHSYACTRQPILPVEHFDHGYYKTSENTYLKSNQNMQMISHGHSQPNTE